MKKGLLLMGVAVLLSFADSFAQCTTTNATSCVCETSGSADCDLLPDIIAARPPLLVSGSNGIIEYSQSGNGSNDGRLRISVSTPNVGHGPLEVRATNLYICGTDTFSGTAPTLCPNSGLPPRQLIRQRVYHKNSNSMSNYDRDAGSMTYHPTHGHMHVDNWGVFTLRKQTNDPDPLNWPIIGNGAKLAFCLMDYGSCSTYGGHCVDSLGNTLLNGNFPNFGLGGGSYNCSPSVQGISSGFTDIYYQYLDGMWIDIPPGTCNGNYHIVVQLDPNDYFLEENENNNVLAVPFTLTQQAPPPSVTFSSLSNVCYNDPAFNLSGGSPAGGTYSGPGVSNGTFNPVVAGIGTHTLNYEYDGGNGCTGSATQTITVVNCGCNPPNIPSTIQGLAKVCMNTNLTYQVNNLASVSSYTWVPPAGTQIVSGQGTHSIVLAIGGGFTSGQLCVTANNNCGASVPRCKTLTKHTAIRPTAIQGEKGGHCQTTQGSLWVSPVSYAVSYDWVVPSGVTITSGQGTPNITFSTAAGFVSGDVCVTSNNGCMNSASRCTKIYATPDKAIIAGPATVCANQVNVPYSVSPVYGATYYNWFAPSGGSISSGQGTTSATVNFGGSGGLIKVAAKNACGKRGYGKYPVTMNCRIANSDNDTDYFELVPNPAKEKTTVTIHSNTPGRSSIVLINILGKVVYSGELTADQGTTESNLDLSMLAPGLYMVQVTTNGKLLSQRLVVE